MPRIPVLLATLALTAAALLAASPAQAWQLPDKILTTGGTTPRAWYKAGGLRQRGRHSIQLYQLKNAHGTAVGVERYVLVWPAPEPNRFCVLAAKPGPPPAPLPEACDTPLPDSSVYMEVYHRLYK